MKTALPLRRRWPLAAGWRLLLILPGIPCAVQAQDWSAAASLSSDYRLRGISLSNRHAAPALDLGYTLDTGWSFGLGLAALDRDADGRRTLLTAGVSRAWQWDASWSAQLGLNHAAYPGPAQRRRYGYDELRAGLQWRGVWSGSLSYFPSLMSKDGYGHYNKSRAFSVETALRQPLGRGLALDGGLGVHSAVGMTSYVYGNLGLAWARGPAQLSLAYIASNAHAKGLAPADSARGGWSGTLIRAF